MTLFTYEAKGISSSIEASTAEGNYRVFGTIKKVVKDKGFGFIIPDDGGDEVFFHRSRLGPKMYFEDLREGNEVQFEVRSGEKGRQAFNVRLR
ncbi:MAG: cold shock domain-containing protein [Deltaproteobacteria bacterium]|jgi:cold shock protein|nr:cold shock domain-containing protein [Deltaproteobacteria bacterium]